MSVALVSEPAVQQPIVETAAAQDSNLPAVDDSQLSTTPNNETESRRRGSAEGFRALADKLKAAKSAPKPAAVQPLPQAQPQSVVQPETGVDGGVAEQPVEQLLLEHAEVQMPSSNGGAGNC